MTDDLTRGDPIKPVEIAGFGRVEDARLKGYNGTVTHPHMQLERTYCGKCGAPFGWVNQETSTMIKATEVVVFCNDCEQYLNTKIGPIPLRYAGNEQTRDIAPLPKKGEVVL